MTRKFVIISHGRTGSTALCHALNEHPDVCCAYELFASGIQASPRPEIVQYQSGCGSRFLSRFYDGGYAPHLGFKMFTFHARTNHEAVRAWDYLLEDRSVRVVILGRRNLIDSYFSEKVATVASNWGPKRSEAAALEQEPLTADYAQAKSYMFRIYAQMAWAQRAFSNHGSMSLWYEDFVSDFAGQVASVQEFLGVPRTPVKLRFVPQMGPNAETMISNYRTIVDQLQTSIFSSRQFRP